MKFNLVLIRPKNNTDVNCFVETVIAEQQALLELGHDVIISENTNIKDRWNILYGYNVIPYDNSYKQYHIIIRQLEQLPAENGWLSWHIGAEMKRFMKNANFIWDYSSVNVKFIQKHLKGNVRLLKHGYSPVLDHLQSAKLQDIDYAFFGGSNPRRFEIFKGISDTLGIRKGVWARHLWGENRDKMLSRVKINLNIHMYDVAIQESARMSYMWNNCFAVVSEICKVDEYPLIPMRYAPKEFLARHLKTLLNCPHELETYRTVCYNAFKDNYRTVDMMRPLVKELEGAW